MKNHLILFSAWINTDPQRVRMILMTLVILMMLMAVLIPGAVTLAGWAPGGSD
jgi:low temperature requirement protein LtrA